MPIIYNPPILPYAPQCACFYSCSIVTSLLRASVLILITFFSFSKHQSLNQHLPITPLPFCPLCPKSLFVFLNRQRSLGLIAWVPFLFLHASLHSHLSVFTFTLKKPVLLLLLFLLCVSVSYCWIQKQQQTRLSVSNNSHMENTSDLVGSALTN